MYLWVGWGGVFEKVPFKGFRALYIAFDGFRGLYRGM